ncbi:MAG: hypothetical protein DCC43_05030 [Candidatus Brocadia sp.]|nr:hypothetical protein [Candidatus Brocadia fulgida]MCE7910860.1 hypothetical protein [Candidatus Brocadia sp. AMX3]MDG5996723.1 hypothetical protein [Candidatus Brocadia sp.]RIK01912.1 MAG: hypothetical protein DCC43_05030 [Candidatus Brocadia sp.]
MKILENIKQPFWMGLVVLTAMLTMPGIVLSASKQKQNRGFTDSFMFDECTGFSSTGRNPFFILEPGHQLVLEGTEDNEEIKLIITVLDETQDITTNETGLVTTRIVEERESIDGELFEVSRNFFAICNRDNSVFYFGEDVDFYEDGVIVSHDGSWRAGVDGARAGIIMPGTILLGSRYFQEVAPDVAMDRAEILSINQVVKTPAEEFKNCLKTKETTPLEPNAKEFKFYAPGVGLIKDGVLLLTEINHL